MALEWKAVEKRGDTHKCQVGRFIIFISKGGIGWGRAIVESGNCSSVPTSFTVMSDANSLEDAKKLAPLYCMKDVAEMINEIANIDDPLQRSVPLVLNFGEGNISLVADDKDKALIFSSRDSEGDEFEKSAVFTFETEDDCDTLITLLEFIKIGFSKN